MTLSTTKPMPSPRLLIGPAVVLFLLLRGFVFYLGWLFYPEQPNGLIGPWDQWDVEYYTSIAQDGYGANPAATSFHPLFPLLGRPFGWLLGANWVAGLLFLNALVVVGLLIWLVKLAEYDIEQPRWVWAGVLALPSAYIMFAPYPEALFILCAVACFWFARQERWWLAGLAGALAAMTRQQGLALILPLLWEMQAHAGGWRSLMRRWQVWCASLLPAVGYAVVIFYRTIVLGGLPDQWWLPQNFIWSVLISSETTEVVKDQQFVMPWTALWRAVEQWMYGPTPFGEMTTIARGVDVFTGVVYLIILGMVWRYLRPSYRIYCGLISLLAFSYHTGLPFAYIALSRHLFLAFPLAIGLAGWATTMLRRTVLILMATIFMICQIILFVSHSWVP